MERAVDDGALTVARDSRARDSNSEVDFVARLT